MLDWSACPAVERDPERAGGAWVFRGSRVPVAALFGARWLPLYAVVSVNAFEGVAPSLLRHASATFEGENEKARLARRKRYWIADVQYVEGST